MNLRMIAYIVRQILKIEALCMVPAALISVFRGETRAALAFAASILLIVAVVFVIQKFFAPRDQNLYAREGFAAVALAWIVISVFGAVPLWISGATSGPIDALFEMVSGFTTTGATVIKDIESLPWGILYWRSFAHWLGGMGVLVFMMAVLPMSKNSGSLLHLLRAESTGPSVSKIAPRMRNTARILYAIYISLTLVMIVFFLAGGMPLFDSILNAFSTAGTGGFAIINAGYAAYSPYLQTVTAVFMMLFGVNFSMFYFLLAREFKQVVKNEEIRWYFGLIVGATVLIAINIFGIYGNVGEALRHSFFQVTSIMSTTGFATADFDAWPQFSRSILVLLTIVGACAGSTAGGVKVSRIMMLVKSTRNQLQKLMHPRSVKVMKVDGRTVEEQVTVGVNVFMVAYFLLAALSLLLISLDNFSFTTNVTAVITTLSNVGPGLEAVGPMSNFAAFSGFSKIVFIFNMLFGRLEIFPMIILFTPSVWRRARA